MGVGVGGMLTVGATIRVGKGAAIIGAGGEDLVGGGFTARPRICAIYEYALRIGEPKAREAWLREGGLALSKCNMSSTVCSK